MQSNHRLILKSIQRTANSAFVRNVMVVASGTAVAQAIAMVFAPFITRIYGPEAFGILGVFLAVLTTLVPIVALTFPIAIVLPKPDAEAKQLVLISFIAALGVTALVSIALLCAGDWFLGLFGAEAIASFVLLIPLAMLFTAFIQIAEQWLIRKKLFAVSAKVAIGQALITNCLKVGVGYFNPIGAILILLTTFGYAVHASMLWYGCRRKNAKLIPNSIETSVAQFSIKKLVRKYYDFPLYRAPQVFINAISKSLPVLLLASFFSPVSAGFYTLGTSVLGMPSLLIGKSVGDVFYPRINEAAHNDEKITRLIVKATLALALAGCAPYLLVMLFGPWLFTFVFGAAWGPAGEYARWISLWMFFMLLNNPSIKALPILSAQGFHLIFTIGSIILRVGALALGYYVFKSDLVSVALFGSLGALINVTLIILILLKSREFDMRRIKRIET